MTTSTPRTSQTAEAVAPAYRGANLIKALPFNPAKLNGLSEQLVTSHHQHHYAAAVAHLNQIEQQIGALSTHTAPSQMAWLRRQEVIATNSMLLHDCYFDNLGGDGKASGPIVKLITRQYGTFEAWETEFRLTCLALGGASGWAILNFSPRDAAVHTYWAADYTHSLVSGTPLLVMDMYEHAYDTDYGTNARGYVNAFFQNVNWDAVNGRARPFV